MSEYHYTETFFSFQGEGKYVGVPSAWLRLFLCNLSCGGFGQEKPTEPSTWALPWEKIDLTDITSYEELPVFEKACDSAYSVAKRFKHLAKKGDARTIANEIRSCLPHFLFNHPVTKLNNDFVITGGEPMLNQKAIIEVISCFISDDDYPKRVTIETNGTREVSKELHQFIKYVKETFDIDFFFSISPKLFNVSGEIAKKAIKTDVLNSIIANYDHQLKFVVNGSLEAWNELDEILNQLYNVKPQNTFIMGVGGTLEGLQVTESNIADQAIDRGYNYTTRAHVHVFGNLIGK